MSLTWKDYDKTIKCYQNYPTEEAAKRLNISRRTLRHRIQNVKKFNPNVKISSQYDIITEKNNNLKQTVFLFQNFPISEVSNKLGIPNQSIYDRVSKYQSLHPEIVIKSFTKVRKDRNKREDRDRKRQKHISTFWMKSPQVRKGILQHGSIKGYIKKRGLNISASTLKKYAKITSEELLIAKEKANVRNLHKTYSQIIKGKQVYPRPAMLIKLGYHSFCTMIFYYYKNFDEFLMTHIQGNY